MGLFSYNNKYTLYYDCIHPYYLLLGPSHFLWILSSSQLDHPPTFKMRDGRGGLVMVTFWETCPWLHHWRKCCPLHQPLLTANNTSWRSRTLQKLSLPMAECWRAQSCARLGIAAICPRFQGPCSIQTQYFTPFLPLSTYVLSASYSGTGRRWYRCPICGWALNSH